MTLLSGKSSLFLGRPIPTKSSTNMAAPEAIGAMRSFHGTVVGARGSIGGHGAEPPRPTQWCRLKRTILSSGNLKWRGRERRPREVWVGICPYLAMQVVSLRLPELISVPLVAVSKRWTHTRAKL